MAMKKAEMESHRKSYSRKMKVARAAEREGVYRDTVKSALSSWQHIDGMMQYERRYKNKEFERIEGIDLVLEYAPLLLDSSTLDRLESLLEETRRLERNTSQSLIDQLANARALIGDCHRLWDHLERCGETTLGEAGSTLGGDAKRWDRVTLGWEKMGLLSRIREGSTFRLKLLTRLGEVISAKCPGCGRVVEAPKAMLLEQTRCMYCSETVLFVFLPKNTSGSEEM